MSTVAKAQTQVAIGEHRFVLYGIDWQGYEAMLKACCHSSARLTYDRGTLEFMSPHPIHERFRRCFGTIIDRLTEELEIPSAGGGSTTFKSEAENRGLEPDECYYIASVGRLRNPTGPEPWNADLDPPPDLAIEVDITSSSVNRLAIYATLGVREVWRFDGMTLSVYGLQRERSYRIQSTSLAFPWLPLDELVRQVLEYEPAGDMQWRRSIRDWIRTDLTVRFQNFAPSR